MSYVHFSDSFSLQPFSDLVLQQMVWPKVGRVPAALHFASWHRLNHRLAMAWELQPLQISYRPIT